MSASNAAQPPLRLCRPQIHSRARSIAWRETIDGRALSAPVHSHHDDGGVVEIRVMRIGELKRPAAGTHVRPARAPIADDIQLLAGQQPFRPAAAASIARSSPTSSSVWHASAVSHTGETQGWQ